MRSAGSAAATAATGPHAGSAAAAACGSNGPRLTGSTEALKVPRLSI